VSGSLTHLNLSRPNLKLQPIALPAHSPDSNPDGAFWRGTREHATANTCLGTAAKLREKSHNFFATLVERKTEVQHRYRTTLQAQAETLAAATKTLR
jgi:hypothetical protein